jgi:hypothetical protein
MPYLTTLSIAEIMHLRLQINMWYCITSGMISKEKNDVLGGKTIPFLLGPPNFQSQ